MDGISNKLHRTFMYSTFASYFIPLHKLKTNKLVDPQMLHNFPNRNFLIFIVELEFLLVMIYYLFLYLLRLCGLRSLRNKLKLDLYFSHDGHVKVST